MGLAPVVEVRAEPDEKWRRLLTHIEIRRVQNGFVVMGFNMVMRPGDYLPLSDRRERVCFVCETVESLCATISSLATDTGDFAWEASIDMPITELFRTTKVEKASG